MYELIYIFKSNFLSFLFFLLCTTTIVNGVYSGNRSSSMYWWRINGWFNKGTNTQSYWAPAPPPELWHRLCDGTFFLGGWGVCGWRYYLFLVRRTGLCLLLLLWAGVWSRTNGCERRDWRLRPRRLRVSPVTFPSESTQATEAVAEAADETDSNLGTEQTKNWENETVIFCCCFCFLSSWSWNAVETIFNIYSLFAPSGWLIDYWRHFFFFYFWVWLHMYISFFFFSFLFPWTSYPVKCQVQLMLTGSHVLMSFFCHVFLFFLCCS